MKPALAVLLCFFMHTCCFGQLRMGPPNEDTMSNAGVARWYADIYKELLGISDAQREQVYQIIFLNRNYLDSMKSQNAITTDGLVKNYFSVDSTLKTVFTERQYYDYLNTGKIHYVKAKK